MRQGHAKGLLTGGLSGAALSACAAVLLGAAQERGEEEMVQIAPAFDVGALDQQAMRERMMDAATPGEHHEMMRRMEGEWSVEVQVFTPGAAQPMTSNMEAVVEPVLGGRFMKETITGALMGSPFEAIGFFGYDNYAGRYEYTTFTNGSTASMRFEGFASQDGEKLVMYGEMDEPTLDVRARTVKTISWMPDEDTSILEVHDMHIGGGNTLVMRWTYERKD